METLDIRKATLHDIDNLYFGAWCFHKEKLSQKTLHFDRKSVYQYFKWLIENPLALVLVANNGSFCGSIGGIITPWVLDFNIKIMTEMFWYVLPKQRGSAGLRLIKEFETMSHDMGANRILMVGLEELNKPISKYYTKHGYKHLEHHFIKEI